MINWLFVALVSLIALSITDIVQVFAQEATGQYVSARVEIWALFYRLMVIAFVIGAIVMGVIGYIVWRFRESNPKNIPREPQEHV